MKNLLLILSFLTVIPAMQAQKFAYVDVDYILGKMPAYRSAQKQLDDLSAKWQKEIETRQISIDKMYKDYKAEELLLTEQQKIERQNAIVQKEGELRAYQEEKFGFGAGGFKKGF